MENTIMKKKTFEMISYAQFIVTALLMILIPVHFYSISVVPSPSMNPTFRQGTFLVADKMDRTPEYDDIMVFFPFEAASTKPGVIGDLDMKLKGAVLYTKRCVGVPGDTIEVHDGHLYRNGEMITADYTADELIEYEMPEVTLGENEYFMMGDNRNNSNDSHLLGPINADKFFGKVIFFIR